MSGDDEGESRELGHKGAEKKGIRGGTKGEENCR